LNRLLFVIFPSLFIMYFVSFCSSLVYLRVCPPQFYFFCFTISLDNCFSFLAFLLMTLILLFNFFKVIFICFLSKISLFFFLFLFFFNLCSFSYFSEKLPLEYRISHNDVLVSYFKGKISQIFPFLH
jgi:hypothetical protein